MTGFSGETGRFVRLGSSLRSVGVGRMSGPSELGWTSTPVISAVW